MGKTLETLGFFLKWNKLSVFEIGNISGSFILKTWKCIKIILRVINETDCNPETRSFERNLFEWKSEKKIICIIMQRLDNLSRCEQVVIVLKDPIF